MFNTEPVYDAKAAVIINTRMTKLLGIPKLHLLEAAGIMAAKSVQTNFPSGGITIVTGLGDKAAVGFAAARHLVSMGREVTLINAFGRRSYRYTTIQMWLTIKALNIVLSRDIPIESSVVIDALLADEWQGRLPKRVVSILKKMNASKIPIIALDIPTGLHSYSNKIPNHIAVQASRTLCFGFKKICHVLFPSSCYVGTTEILDIGLIKDFNCVKFKGRKKPRSTSEQTTRIESIISCRLPKRQETGHKNVFGHTLIIGGSIGYLGAPYLAGIAALQIGAGLVTVVVPENASKLGSPCYPAELMVTTPPNSTSEFQARDSEFVLQLIQEKNISSVAIGMGIGIDSIDFIAKILSNVSIPVVVDGEALAIFSKKMELKSSLVFATPHPGEFRKYISKSTLDPEIVDLERTANRLSIDLAFKSVTPIVTDGKRTFVFEHSYAALAKAGSGDVLSGVIAGLAGQGFGKLSLPAAVWIHHTAGKKLHEKAFDYAATAGDIAYECQQIAREISR